MSSAMAGAAEIVAARSSRWARVLRVSTSSRVVAISDRAGVHRFGSDVRETWYQRLTERRVLFDQCTHLAGRCSEATVEMKVWIGDGELPIPRCAEEFEVLRPAALRSVEPADGDVDRVLSHLPVRGEFATGHAYNARIAHFDLMLTGEIGGALR